MTEIYIVFEHPTKPKEYRTYPAICQWATREKVCEWLQKRIFLTDYIVTKIREY